MSKSIFSNEFIERLTEFLDESCADGTCVNRKNLCSALNIDPVFDSTMGAMIKLGIIPGYRIWMGPTGGIGKVGVQPPKRARVGASSAFPEGFLDNLRGYLDRLCEASDMPVPRRVVAEKMGMPGSATENMISAALKMDQFKNDFLVKNGRYGGIELKNADAVVATTDVVVESDDNVAGLDKPFTDVNASLDTNLEDSESNKSWVSNDYDNVYDNDKVSVEKKRVNVIDTVA